MYGAPDRGLTLRLKVGVPSPVTQQPKVGQENGCRTGANVDTEVALAAHVRDVLDHFAHKGAERRRAPTKG